MHGRGVNVDKLEAFIHSIEKKDPAMVRVTQYTTEGDAIIKDIIYDGSSILVKEDYTRDKWSSQENRKVYVYKISNISVSKSDDGAQYNAILENGETLPITWINSK